MAPFQSLQPGASTPLAELSTANPNGLVVWGVVVDFKSPRETKGNDMAMSMRLADASIPGDSNKGTSCLLFFPDRLSFPPVTVGDAVRVRHFTLQPHLGAMQLMTRKDKERNVVTRVDVVRRGESVVSWTTPAQGGEPRPPPTLTVSEAARARALHSLAAEILLQTAERDWGFMHSMHMPGESWIDCVVQKRMAQESTGDYAGAFVDEGDGRQLLLKAFGAAASALLDVPNDAWLVLKRAQLKESLEGRVLVCGRRSSLTRIYSDHPLVLRAKQEYGGGGGGGGLAPSSRPAVMPVPQAGGVPRPNSSGRPQFSSFAAPPAPARVVISKTAHGRVAVSTLAEVKDAAGPAHFRCLTRIRAVGPVQDCFAIQPFCRTCRSAAAVNIEGGPQNLLCNTCGTTADTVFKLTVVLEDDTGILETNLFAEEAETFIGAQAAQYFTDLVTRIKFGAVMQKLQEASSWLDCCVMAYTVVDPSNPARGPQLRYRIFGTTFTG